MMDNFHTSLLQEKFTITDKSKKDSQPIVIASNRMEFTIGSNAVSEKVVIRTKHGYLAMLLSFKILREFFDNGLFFDRAHDFDWGRMWNSTLSLYDTKYNSDIWGVVYINGKSVFQTQAPPFIDIIENCAGLIKENYDAIPETLETMLHKAGRDKKVEYVFKVAATVQEMSDKLSCGTICYTEDGGNAFVFDFSGGNNKKDRLSQAVMVCAAQLEASWLEAFITRDDFKTKRQMNEATSRKYSVQKFIKGIEEKYKIEYFPYKPNS